MPAASTALRRVGCGRRSSGAGGCGLLLGDSRRTRCDGRTCGRPDRRASHLRRRRRPGSGSRPSPARGTRRSGRAPASNPCRGMSGRPRSRARCRAGVLSRTLSKSRPGMRLGRVAGQHLARRRDVDDAAAPAAHAGLGAPGVVVRHDEVDDEDALEALARLARRARRCSSTWSRVGIRAWPVLQRPAVVLHVRHLEPLRAEALGQLDEGRQAVDVLAVDRAR